MQVLLTSIDKNSICLNRSRKINLEMCLLKLLVVSLLMLIASSSRGKYQVSSFWLTDMTMFQPPVGISLNNDNNNNNKPSQLEQQDTMKSTSSNFGSASVADRSQAQQMKSEAEKSLSSVPKVDNAIPWLAKVSAKDGKVSLAW